MLTRYGGLYDQHANRTAPYSVREGVSSLLEAPSIKQDGRKDCLEERIQHANMAWWRDVKIHRSKDVPSRVKCRRMVEHVYSVFCFGSEKVGPGVKPSWTESKDGKQKTMRCLCSASNRKTMRTSLGTGKGRLHDLDKDEAAISCDLYGREIHFTNSKTLVGWSMSRPTVTRVAFDLPECNEQK